MAKPKNPAIKPDLTTGIQQEMIEQAIRLRYSPFPELTMAILTMQLNQFRVGDLRAARTWEIMMERDGDLSGPAYQRFSDAARLPWEIEKTEQSAEADNHAASLEYFYNNLTATSILEQDEAGGANMLFRQMMTAKAMRYSVHEMLLRVNSASKREVTAQFNHCPVYFFESRKGRLAFLKNLGDFFGEPLEYGRWLPAVGEGLMRPCSIGYFIKHGPLRDWMLYCSRFGLPGIHGETDAQFNSDDWNKFTDALKAFANDWITVTNRNAKINLIEAAKGGSGTLPFGDLIDKVDRLFTRLFRGGDLSGKSRDGNDVVGASLQGDEKAIMGEDDGQWLTDTLNTRVDEPVIAYLYNTTPKAWIRVRPKKLIDTDKEASKLKTARDLNIPVSIQTARERLDLPAPADDDELIGESIDETTTLGNAKDAQAFAAAIADDLKPIITAISDRMERILAITDPELRKQKFEQLWTDLEPLRKGILADPSSAQVLEQINAQALADGLLKKPAPTNP